MATDADIFKKLGALTAGKILAIPEQEPEWLFSGNADTFAKEFRYLLKTWHPDHNHNPQAKDVFDRVMKLREAAEKKFAAGAWTKPNELSLTSLDGHAYRLKFRKKSAFALGTMYIGQKIVAFVVKPEHKALYDNAVETIKALPFADDKMREQLGRATPRILKTFDTKDAHVLVLEKDPSLVLLRDAADHFGGRLDPRHAAWVLSSLHNYACYLSWAGLTHNDISPDTYFIDPKGHSGALLGGWWYARPSGKNLTAMPERSYDRAPPDVKREGRADPRVDLGLIRLTGRELLGDADGDNLLRDKDIPIALATWLRMPTGGDAREDYAVWSKTILKKSFGARRYVEMQASFSDIYAKGETPWVPSRTSTSPPTPNPAQPS